MAAAEVSLQILISEAPWRPPGDRVPNAGPKNFGLSRGALLHTFHLPVIAVLLRKSQVGSLF